MPAQPAPEPALVDSREIRQPGGEVGGLRCHRRRRDVGHVAVQDRSAQPSQSSRFSAMSQRRALTSSPVIGASGVSCVSAPPSWSGRSRRASVTCGVQRPGPNVSCGSTGSSSAACTLDCRSSSAVEMTTCLASTTRVGSEEQQTAEGDGNREIGHGRGQPAGHVLGQGVAQGNGDVRAVGRTGVPGLAGQTGCGQRGPLRTDRPVGVVIEEQFDRMHATPSIPPVPVPLERSVTREG